jgi:phosphoribosylformimino-5-aminoimidazole carboxamide ribotide isomerase
MMALPAIDLRGGACVQLVGGDYDHERVRLPDPVAVARAFREAGFGALHVVDLDAATGRGDNASVIDAIARERDLEIQVGGGVRDVARAEALFALGARRVVVGTRGVEDRSFREDVARRFPGRIVLALDVRGTDVLVRGWQASTGRDVLSLLEELADIDLAGVLVTAVHREGQLAGPDIELMTRLAASTRHALIASGGVTTASDLEALENAGCRAAVIGMALYTGALDRSSTARRFCRW